MDHPVSDRTGRGWHDPAPIFFDQVKSSRSAVGSLACCLAGCGLHIAGGVPEWIDNIRHAGSAVIPCHRRVVTAHGGRLGSHPASRRSQLSPRGSHSAVRILQPGSVAHRGYPYLLPALLRLNSL